MTTKERPSTAPAKPCARRWLFLALVFLAALVVDGGLPEAAGPGKSGVSKSRQALNPGARRAADFLKGKGPQRLRDGRFVPSLFPPLGAPKAKPVEKDVYRLTSESVQKHPVALLRRDRDGRFTKISSAQLSADKNLLTEQKRHDAAVTDIIATAIRDAGRSTQSSVPPVNSIHLSMDKLANDENLHSRRSVGADLELPAAKLSDVSKITIVQRPPAVKAVASQENVIPAKTELEVELKPVAGQEVRFLGRVKLDEVIRQINSNFATIPAKRRIE